MMSRASPRPDPDVPSPSPEQRRVAAGQFERANQVVATGDYDYGIHLLRGCCKIDPANLLYRQALRRAEKAKFRNNLRGSWLAWLWSWPTRARLKAARSAGRSLEVLELGEQILTRNPWDVGAQTDMADAAEALGLLDLAVWFVEQARHKKPRDADLARRLARLYERRGNFTQAMAVWELVRQVDPGDGQAAAKLRELAVSETLNRGNLEDELDPSVPARPGGAAREPTLPAAEAVGREAAAIRLRLEDDPTNAVEYLTLARTYRKAGKLEQAHEVLCEGRAATGNDFELSVEMADLEAEPFRRNLAITEEKLAAAPDDPELRRLRVHLRKEVNSRELDLWRLKSDRQPADLGCRYELGVRLMRAGQLDEAIKELQTARAELRLRWKSALQLGLCFQARKNLELARRNFEEALADLPGEETAHRKDLLYELARCHAGAGDLARAIEIGNELAHLDFAHRDVAKLLDEWKARQRQAS
jgi:tetratricopeptide (TPR) repeat protein